MACMCGTAGGTFVSCLRRYLGVSASQKWDEEAHRAMYARMATMINVQGNRGQTSEQIRSVGYGAEPEISGQYAGNYPTQNIPAGDAFWSCMGLTRAEAATQAASASGAYYDAMLDVMRHVKGCEDGTEDKSSGVPWWLWALGGVAVVGGAYLLLED